MIRKVILGYIRKSIIDPDEATASPARQRAAVERACPRDCALEWYEDLNLSGRHESKRLGWQALLARLSDPDVAGVIVESYDRSHRNVREFLSFYDNHLAPRGLVFISATQNIDLSTADGRAMASVLAAFSEMESRKAGERMAATIRYKVEKEGRHFGATPFGCGRHAETKHLIPSTRFYWYNPATRETQPGDADLPPPWERRFFHDSLRAIFDTYSNGGYSVNEAGQALNLAGWRHWEQDCKTPKPFNRQTVHSVVRRWRLYAGELPPSPTTSIKQNRNRPILPGGHEPILPVELCERVGVVFRARHLARRASGPPRSPYHQYLLSGLLYCGRCGQAMSGQGAQRGRYHYYRHQYSKGDCTERMVPALDLEAQMMAIVQGILAAEPLFRQIVDRLRSALLVASDDDGDEAELQRRREEHERLIDLRVTGAISRAEIDRRDGPLRAELERLEKTTTPPGDTAEVDALVDEIMSYLGQLTEADPYQQKALLRAFVQRIKIVDGQIAAIVVEPWAEPFFMSLCELKSERLVTDWLNMFVILG